MTRALALAVILGSCGYRDYVLVDPDTGPALGWVEPAGACTAASSIDLLLVVDDSSSTDDEQTLLAAALHSLAGTLTSPPDDDADGRPDWPPITSLHAAVVTTDMGTGGAAIPTCGSGTFGAMLGDDGIFVTRGSSAPGCSLGAHPPILSFEPLDPMGLFQLGCAASLGSGGCSYEQPLEAMLKALSPSAPASYTAASYAPPAFFAGTSPHGDRQNAGLVRDDSLLAVLVVTDEDDCSAADVELFDPASTTYATAPDLRCAAHPAALHPPARYVDGLLALRARRPDLLALAVLAGVPPDVSAVAPTPADYAALLARPEMQGGIDTGVLPPAVRTSCTSPAGRTAQAPRRLVRVAQGLGTGRATVQSICNDDFGPALGAAARLFGRRACASRAR